MPRNSDILKNNARSLRRNMTRQERHLRYDFLRFLPINVNRQKILGNSIVDFYVASRGIVIELDGSQHYESKGRQSDRTRDGVLADLGCRVLRCPNNEIDQNFEGVCRDIAAQLGLDYDKLTFEKA